MFIAATVHRWAPRQKNVDWINADNLLMAKNIEYIDGRQKKKKILS
jgi:hypothetical protein